jgi:hypothetical protein
VFAAMDKAAPGCIADASISRRACVQARMATRTDLAGLTLRFGKMSVAPGPRRRLVGRA